MYTCETGWGWNCTVNVGCCENYQLFMISTPCLHCTEPADYFWLCMYKHAHKNSGLLCVPTSFALFLGGCHKQQQILVPHLSRGCQNLVLLAFPGSLPKHCRLRGMNDTCQVVLLAVGWEVAQIAKSPRSKAPPIICRFL